MKARSAWSQSSTRVTANLQGGKLNAIDKKLYGSGLPANVRA